MRAPRVGDGRATSDEAPRQGRGVVAPRALGLLAALGLMAGLRGHGGEAAGEAAFEVSEFLVHYGGADDPDHALHGGHPALPAAAEVMQWELVLGKVADGYVALERGGELVRLTLAGVPALPVKRFYDSGLRSITRQLVEHFHRRDLIGVFVAFHRDDLVVSREPGAEGQVVERVEDRREAGRTSVRLQIWTGVVTEVRTLASGLRIPAAERINHPAHAGIREGSPVVPYVEGQVERRDLLRRGQLERHIFWLSRHPGRRVDLALSSADVPGGVVLDYLVTENKPWWLYFQASNTGTKFTRPWRERFGFVHNQLTGHDDILTLEYITAGFSEANTLVGSYEAPLWGVPRVRWRVFGSWTEYTASDVGIAKLEFGGEGWHAGGELIANVFQHKRFFVDAVAGARWERVEVVDEQTGLEGKDDLFIPHAGLRFERLTETASTWGSAIVEWTMAGVSDTDLDELEQLGRLDPDKDWTILKFDANQSLYLEPLLSPTAWADPKTYQSSTLAHEFFASFRGQYAFGDRLIPQAEQVAGGLYSVRGYPESLVAGDSVYVGTVEYRFHVPRIFPPREPTKLPFFGTPFRYAPQQVYGRPDWDLIARAFYDAGRAVNVHKKSYEHDQTLQGCGVGLELRYRSNFSVRCDYAVALEDVATESRFVGSGNNEIHTVVTISF